MPIWEANLMDSAFVTELPQPAITFEGRRFLLVPIVGSVGNPNYEVGEGVQLDPLKLRDFNDDAGWPDGTQEILSHMDIGESVCQFDGIGQAQMVVRVC